jgi:phage/plasmid-associated DNA primase
MVGQWLSEHCELGQNFKTASDDYYEDWEEWREAKGEQPVTQRSLTTKLKLRGFKLVRIGNKRDRGLQGFKSKSAPTSAQAEEEERNAELLNDDDGAKKARAQ